MRKFCSSLAAVLAVGFVAPALAEGPVVLTPVADDLMKPESVLVKGGEHPKYSRVVIEAKGAPYKIDFSHRKIRVVFPGQLHAYDLALINDKRKAHRVIKGKAVDNVGESGIEFDLNCNCGARVDYSKSGSLIVDISEAYGATPTAQIAGAPKKPREKKEESEAPATILAGKGPDGADVKDDASRLEADDTLENARSKMIALLTQAADEGLVTLKDAPEQKATGAKNASSKGAKNPLLNRYKCAPTNQFFPGATAAAAEAPLERINTLQAQLVGEFDAANEAVVRGLFWTYLAIGFGDEAGSILDAFPLPPNEQEFLKELARVVADRKLPEESPLRRSYGCKGLHAIWRAVGLAGESPGLAIREADPWMKSLDRLPVELRGDFAARLGLAAVAAKEWKVADRYKQIAEYVKEDSSAYKYLTAELDRHRGREDKARVLFTELAEGQSEHQRDALFALAEEYAKSGEEPPEGFTDDLGIVAAVAETSAIKEQAIVMEASALISAGEFDAAFQEIIRTYRAAPGARAGLGLAARTLLMEAMTSGDDEAKLAALDAYMDHQSFWEATARGGNTDALHTVAARTAVSFGLPVVASQSLGRRAGRPNAEAYELERKAALLTELTGADLGADEKGRAVWARRLADVKRKSGGTLDQAAAKKLARMAYLAGVEADAEVIAALEGDALDYEALFREERSSTASNAAAVKKIADDASADVALLREIVDGR